MHDMNDMLHTWKTYKVEFIQSLVGFLFRAKFACNSTFKNPIFKWESCKGSVWESVKKSSRICTQEGPHDWILWLASRQSWHTCEACRGVKGSRQLLHYKTKLPIWPGHKVATRSSHELKSPNHSVCYKTDSSHSIHTLLYIPLYPQNLKSFQRIFWERNPREKQNWLIHNLHLLILQIPLLSPSPLLHP